MMAWYDQADPTGLTDSGERGLRFSCTMCGNCCTGPSGYVLFDEREGRAMAAKLGVGYGEFLEKYTHETSLGRSLNEKRSDYGLDCVFLDRESVVGKAVCGLYEARPMQCRTWPFWPGNLKSRDAWARAGRTCPGIDHGDLHEPRVVQLTVESMLERE